MNLLSWILQPSELQAPKPSGSCTPLYSDALYPGVQHPWIQPTTNQKYLKKSYVFADVYLVVRPTMVVSV